MKIPITSNYLFDKTAGTITFIGDNIPSTSGNILAIINSTQNTIIYQTNGGSTLGGIYASPVLTLSCDTSSMSNTDVLLIYIEDGLLHNSSSINTISTEVAQNYSIPQKIVDQETIKRYWCTSDTTANSAIDVIDIEGYKSFTITFVGNSQTQFRVEGSNNGYSWSTLKLDTLNSGIDIVGDPFVPTPANHTMFANKSTKFIRIVKINSQTDNISICVGLSQVVYPPKSTSLSSFPNQQWVYTAPTTGFSAATTTIKASGSPYNPNYITRIMVKNTGTAATEISITDGTTTYWRWLLNPGETFDDRLEQYIKVAGNANVNIALSVTSLVNIYAIVRGFTGNIN